MKSFRAENLFVLVFYCLYIVLEAELSSSFSILKNKSGKIRLRKSNGDGSSFVQQPAQKRASLKLDVNTDRPDYSNNMNVPDVLITSTAEGRKRRLRIPLSVAFGKRVGKRRRDVFEDLVGDEERVDDVNEGKDQARPFQPDAFHEAHRSSPRATTNEFRGLGGKLGYRGRYRHEDEPNFDFERQNDGKEDQRDYSFRHEVIDEPTKNYQVL
jgi:hypothetical protein